MTDFDLLFSRLRGLTWSHVAMAGACFVFATALFVSPAWGYADFARLQQLLSWFGIVAGSLSLVAAFAMRAGWTLRGVEPAVGLVLLLGGLWTLNFPFSVDTFVPVGISLVCSSFFPGSASSLVPCRWSPPSPCARDGRCAVSSPRWVSFFCWAACGR